MDDFIVADIDGEYWVMELNRYDSDYDHHDKDVWYKKYAKALNRLNAQIICAALNRGNV